LNKNDKNNEAARISLLFRAGRKDRGFSQLDVSQALGISQGTLSKLENGVLSPSATLWFDFCSLTGIPSDSLLTGKIDHGHSLSGKILEPSDFFRIKSKYKIDSGSSVRSVLPFLIQAKANLGQKKSNSLIEHLGVDPDYFCNVDHSISISFLFDFWKELEKLRVLDRAKVLHFAVHSRAHEVHGPQFAGDLLSSSGTSGFVKLINRSRLYDRNFRYNALYAKGAGEVVLNVTPDAHMERHRASHFDGWGKFICDYKKSYFLEFLKKDPSVKVSMKEIECMFQGGGDRCAYEYRVA